MTTSMTKVKERRIQVNDKLFIANEDDLISKSEYFRALFNPSFADSNQEVIQIKEIVGVSSFQAVLNYCQNKNSDLPKDLSDLLDLLLAAQTLVIDDLIHICIKHLKTRLLNLTNKNDICDILKVSELVSGELKQICLTKISQSFDNVDKQYLLQLDLSENTIGELIESSHLMCKSDVDILDFIISIKNDDKRTVLLMKLLTKQILLLKEHLWAKKNVFHDHENVAELQTKLNELTCLHQNAKLDITQLKSSFQTSLRSSRPFIYCIGAKCKDAVTTGNISLYTCDPRSGVICEENQHKINDLSTLKGCSITTLIDGFIVAGGEYKYGKNNWNMNISKYQYSTSSFVQIGSLPGPRRHHTALLDADSLYLLGGFNQTRVMLSDMLKINLTTGDRNSVELPNRGYNIAATLYEKKIVIAMNGGIYVFCNDQNVWLQKVLAPESIPDNVEFHHAFCYQHVLYLTCNFQTSVYSFDLGNTEAFKLKEVGKLKKEAERPCQYGHFLFNIAKDDLLDFDSSGEKVVERFDLRTGVTEIMYKFELPFLLSEMPLFWKMKDIVT